MSRIRTIKPDFPQSESIGRVSRDARLLFVSLWTIVDDDGRARAASRMLASLLFPYDTDAGQLIDGWLEELEREEMIRRYVVDGSIFLEVTSWRKHQRIDRPTESKLPKFGEGSRFVAKARETSRGFLAGLEGIGKEGKGEDRKGLDLERRDEPDAKAGAVSVPVLPNPSQPAAQPIAGSSADLVLTPSLPASAPANAAPRPANELFDALAMQTGSKPSELTKDARRACGVALASIKAVCPGLTVAEIASRAANYRQQFSGAACTPSALAKHWAQCANAPNRRNPHQERAPTADDHRKGFFHGTEFDDEPKPPPRPT